MTGRITVVEDGSTDPATVLSSGAGEVRLSPTAEAVADLDHTVTLEEYRAAEARRRTQAHG